MVVGAVPAAAHHIALLHTGLVLTGRQVHTVPLVIRTGAPVLRTGAKVIRTGAPVIHTGVIPIVPTYTGI